MKSFLGSLLLILGTVVASLAAASNERPWKPVSLDAVALDDPDTLLYDDVLPSAAEGEEAEPVARRAEPVTAAVVAALRDAGEDSVRVRKLPRDDEQIEVTPELGGRILAEDLWIDAETEALLTREAAEARLEAEAAFRARQEQAEAASESEPANGPETAAESTPEGAAAEGLEDPVAPQAEAADTDGALEPDLSGFTPADLEAIDGDARLGGLPMMRKRYRSGQFIDPDVAAFLSDGGRSTVSVKVPGPPFEFGEWAGKIPFGIGVVAMLGGVVLMRGGRREAMVLEQERDDDEQSPSELLSSIAGAVEALSDQRHELDGDALLARADVILNRQCAAFVEARDALRLQLGGAKYAGVMASFSTGERRLSRSWSAAADGYLDEARVSLEESVEPFQGASMALAGLVGDSPPGAQDHDTADDREPESE